MLSQPDKSTYPSSLDTWDLFSAVLQENAAESKDKSIPQTVSHLWSSFWQILLLTNITISTRQSLCCTETSGTVSLIPRMVSGKMRRKLTRRTDNSFRQGESSEGLNSVKYLKNGPNILLCAAVSWSRGSKVWCTLQLLSESSNIRQFCERSSIKPFDVMPIASSSLKWLTFIPNIQ